MQLILIVFKNGVSANLKKEFLLHHTNPDQPKIKALQNTKNTFCLSPHRLTQSAQYQNWIANT